MNQNRIESTPYILSDNTMLYPSRQKILLDFGRTLSPECWWLTVIKGFSINMKWQNILELFFFTSLLNIHIKSWFLVPYTTYIYKIYLFMYFCSSQWYSSLFLWPLLYCLLTPSKDQKTSIIAFASRSTAIGVCFTYHIQPSLNLNYHPPRPITAIYTADH